MQTAYCSAHHLQVHPIIVSLSFSSYFTPIHGPSNLVHAFTHALSPSYYGLLIGLIYPYLHRIDHHELSLIFRIVDIIGSLVCFRKSRFIVLQYALYVFCALIVIHGVIGAVLNTPAREDSD